MTFTKRFWVLILPALLVAAGCNRAAVEDPAPVETTEEPSPTPSPTPDTFELEGRVVEASGSAEGRAATPSPGGTATTSSPTESPGGTAAPTDGETPAGEAPLFRNASPGSVALTLTSFSGQGPCTFNSGDTVVVSFTGNTTIEPSTVAENERFPNNLIRASVRVTGDVLEPEEGCILVARTLNVTEEASPSPTARARSGRTTTPTRSPSPRAATRPTATASPSPTATGTPGTPGTPGA